MCFFLFRSVLRQRLSSPESKSKDVVIDIVRKRTTSPSVTGRIVVERTTIVAVATTLTSPRPRLLLLHKEITSLLLLLLLLPRPHLHLSRQVHGESHLKRPTLQDPQSLPLPRKLTMMEREILQETLLLPLRSKKAE